MADRLTEAELAAIAAYNGPVTRLPAFETTIGPYQPVSMARQIRTHAEQAKRVLAEREAQRLRDVAARDAETRELAARMTAKEMAGHLGVTPARVSYRLAQAQVKALPSERKGFAANLLAQPRVALGREDLLQMVRQGMAIGEIAAALKVSKSGAYKRLRASGIKLAEAA